MSRWHFAIALILPVSLEAQPGPSSHSIENWGRENFTRYCEAYVADPASMEGATCRGFLLGFVAGAIAVQESVAPAGDGDNFDDRATRTRVGSRLERLELNALPWFCLSSDTTLAEIASSALATLNAGSTADITDVATAMRRALAQALPCDTD